MKLYRISVPLKKNKKVSVDSIPGNLYIKDGFLKINNYIFSTEIWKNNDLFRFFVIIKIKASFFDFKCQITGLDIKKGSFCATLNQLCEESNFSKQRVRTFIKKLINMGELEVFNYKKFLLFKIKN